MMRELSLHILDIVQNSIAARAAKIHITIVEDLNQDLLWFTIKDNGQGMTKETLENVTNPFFTTRTTRRVGLGIPMLQAAAEACGGKIIIESSPETGTYFKAIFQFSHIDRPPLGDMAATMLTIILGLENSDVLYHHQINDKVFCFSTREMREILGDISFQNPEVMQWLREFLSEGEKTLL